MSIFAPLLSKQRSLHICEGLAKGKILVPIRTTKRDNICPKEKKDFFLLPLPPPLVVSYSRCFRIRPRKGRKKVAEGGEEAVSGFGSAGLVCDSPSKNMGK